MKKPVICVVAMSSAACIPSAASACDLDGSPAMSGFHRFDPFAITTRGFDAPPQPQQSDSVKAEATEKAEKKTKDRERRRKAIDATPVRDWEGDQGNGPITSEDKATFT